MGLCASTEAASEESKSTSIAIKPAAQAAQAVEMKESEAKTQETETKTQGVGVVRREIRYAPPEFQNRFAAAIAKMQENTVPGKNSSEYYRLAGYHGWPSKYCTHGREDFPTWHRAYLADFERALIAADKANGNDGNIGLPYWDWSDLKGPDGKEPFPRILNDPRLAQLPKGFFQEPPTGRGASLLKPFKRRTDIAQQLLNAEVANMAADALRASHFAQFASTKGGQISIEDSHNSVHVAVGFPMSAVDTAAFDVTFWLHHCNVDRYWQKYLEDNAGAKDEADFLGRHQRQVDPQEPNLFLQPFAPFTHPKTAKPFVPAEAFTLDGLDYHYDKLPPTPQDTSHMLRELPSYAVFRKINIVDMKLETYALHVFIVNSNLPAPEISTDPSTFHTIRNYAGMIALFGGKEGCENCLARVPFDLRVNLTAALARTDESRYDVQLFVIAVDSMGESHALSDTPVPQPVIQGPLFEDMQTEVGETTQGSSDGDVKAMQGFLLFHGFLEDSTLDLDGWFGPLTTEALKAYQASVGLPQTGKADAATKRMMVAPKLDQKAVSKAVPNREKGSKLSYWVGECPAHLNRQQVLKEIQQAFDLWQPATGITWSLIERDTDWQAWTDCDVEILWHDQHFHNERARKNQEDVKLDAGDRENLEIEFEFDGPGGQLGHSGFDFIHLDQNEVWLTTDMKKTNRSHWFMFNVVLHEIGHLLGLEHSLNPQDLMAPFYDDARRIVTEGDVRAFHAMYESVE